MITLSGSAKFLQEQRTSAKKSAMSLIYNMTTMNEEVMLKQLKKKIDFDALETDEATHVLTGIDWGAACTVTAEYEFYDSEEKKEIEGGLEAEMNKLKAAVDVGGHAKVKYNDGTLEKEEKFRFYSKCDVGNKKDDLPTTFEEAVKQAKKLPSLIKGTNSGKGVPQKFYLTPLEVVKKWFRLESKINVTYTSINEAKKL